jgi:alpha-beta hydrolase superfamily lysophospholipase
VHEWSEVAARADTVLEVSQIAQWAHQLSPDVTVLRVQDAIHDVFLSRKDVRQAALDSVGRWLGYALP